MTTGPIGVHTGGASWAELMDDLQRCLARAESSKGTPESAGHLLVARVVVSQLQRWCHENEGAA